MNKERCRESFFISLLVGIFVHIFAITNVLHNYDTSVMTPYGYGTGSTSGRWFLGFLAKWQSKLLFGTTTLNVPWFNILLSILLLAVTSMLIVEILDIKNKKMIWLSGIIFVIFPTAVSNIAFHFTCHYYAVAILLAVSAVWLNVRFKKLGWIASVICLILSLGIYQGFYPLAVSFSLILFIKLILSDNIKLKDTIFYGLKSIGILGSGVIGYFIVTKIDMRVRAYELSSYKSISSMGTINIKELPLKIYCRYLNIGLIHRNNYYGVNETPTLKNMLLVLGVISVLLLLITVIVRKKVLRGIIAILTFALLPVALDCIGIMCPTGIYTLMVYGSVGAFYVPIVIYEIFNDLEISNKDKIKKYIDKAKNVVQYIIILCLLLVSVNYAWLANGNYLILYYTQEQTVAFFDQLYTKIRATEGYELNMPYAFVGEPNDPKFSNLYDADYVPFNYGGTSKELVGRYSQYMLVWLYTGIMPQSQVSYEELEEIKTWQEVQNMPVYPSDGSIIVKDGVVIVKFAE